MSRLKNAITIADGRAMAPIADPNVRIPVNIGLRPCGRKAQIRRESRAIVPGACGSKRDRLATRRGQRLHRAEAKRPPGGGVVTPHISMDKVAFADVIALRPLRP